MKNKNIDKEIEERSGAFATRWKNWRMADFNLSAAESSRRALCSYFTAIAEHYHVDLVEKIGKPYEKQGVIAVDVDLKRTPSAAENKYLGEGQKFMGLTVNYRP